MNRVREIREAAGISQAALHRQLKWTQPRLANYESGARTPGLEDSRRIVDALNALGVPCSLDQVFPDSVSGPADVIAATPSQEQQPKPEGFVERRRPGAQAHAGIRTGRRATDATFRERLLALAAAKRGEKPE
jgi:putative transcriptional regulator